MLTKRCVYCDKEFIKGCNVSKTVWSRRKYCSQSCAGKDRGAFHYPEKGERRSPATEFKPGHSRGKRFEKGHVPWNKKPDVFIDCVVCNKRVQIKPHEKETRKFCSISCHVVYKFRKPDSYDFKTKLNQRIRTSKKYKDWRTSIYQRDSYTCLDCGQVGGHLNVDHVKRFAVIVDENNVRSLDDAYDCQELWDTSNGRTLCIDCHQLTATYCEGSGNPNLINAY